MTEVRLEEKSEKTKQERQQFSSIEAMLRGCFRDEDDEMNDGQGR